MAYIYLVFKSKKLQAFSTLKLASDYCEANDISPPSITELRIDGAILGPRIVRKPAKKTAPMNDD